ncbi:hypothetical protein FHG87_000467 [Trinorchestia longiramus]|nr:hypothetical protein FHG87_000467 [Trinorchestia longiramus]
MTSMLGKRSSACGDKLIVMLLNLVTRRPSALQTSPIPALCDVEVTALTPTWKILMPLLGDEEADDQALDKPTLKEGTQAVVGEEDDYVYLSLVFRHFEDTVVFSKTRRGRGLPHKGPGIVGGGRPIQRRLETSAWPPSDQQCCGARRRSSPALLGVYEVSCT